MNLAKKISLAAVSLFVIAQFALAGVKPDPGTWDVYEWQDTDGDKEVDTLVKVGSLEMQGNLTAEFTAKEGSGLTDATYQDLNNDCTFEELVEELVPPQVPEELTFEDVPGDKDKMTYKNSNGSKGELRR